jgi:hypothetical protein
MHLRMHARSKLLCSCVDMGMQTVTQLFIALGTFWHFVKCQKVRMQLHAMHSSKSKQTLTYISLYMARAADTYVLLLGLRRNTGVFLWSWVAIYIPGTLRSCATAEESQSIGMGTCATTSSHGQ